MMRPIPFLSPRFTSSDIRALTRSLKSGWLVLGRETKLFERDFAHYLGTRHAVLTNSATTSLHLCLILAGVRPGDEVITSPLSYVSTATAILHAGARPVFVDVDPATGLLDLDKVEAAFTERTRAVIPVHLWGQMVPMKLLQKLCDGKRVPIIEDAAHAIESAHDGSKPGQLSFAACFSFHVSKTITSGEGGCIATNDSRIAAQARLLRRDGIRNVGFRRRMEMLGYKYLLTDFQAAFLRSQLKRIDSIYAARRAVHDTYTELLRKEGFPMPGNVPGGKSAYLFCIVMVPNRHKLMAYLQEHGIETAIHYDPIHLEPYFRRTFGYKKGDFPITEHMGSRVLSLPLHAAMTKGDVRYIAAKLAEFFDPGGRPQVQVRRT